MKGIRVKVSWTGEVYVDGSRLAPAGYEAFFEDIRKQNAGLVCYREGVGREPSPEQRKTVDALQASGLELIDASRAPSEWGQLKSFEFERTPNLFRISAFQSENMLFAYMPDGGDKPLTYQFKGVGDGALKNLDLLISSNRIVETKPRQPDRAFDDETLGQSGFHLRFAYENERIWQGWFPHEETPLNVENLFYGCRSLGLHVVKSSVGPQPPEARPS